jgi:hypothetical protein
LCDPLGCEALEPRTWITDAAGCVLLDDLLEGTWRFVVIAEGHVAREIGPLELRAGDSPTAELDLGELQLAPVH